MKYFRSLFLITFFPLMVCAQLPEFDPPVDIPIELNGNFGELRGNHFHAGIDIKTKGETGLPVFSIDDGYVSRIAVSPSGYGRALYVRHPSGYTSVYAHLESFSPEIHEWVVSQQYKEKRFALNLFPQKNQFSLKKGEQIASAGNSGRSAGPHLHFEIRKTENEHPVNPLFFNFDIADNTRPTVEHLFVYPLGANSHVESKFERQEFPVVFYGGKYHLKGKQSFNLYGEIGFGVDAIDYLDNNWSKCGIYQLEYWVDNQLINSFELSELNYSTMRYLNSHIDYEAYKKSNLKIHKTFIDPGNKLEIYRQSYNGGIYDFDDGKRHKVQIVLYDVSMNASTIEFYVNSTVPLEHPIEEYTAKFEFYTDNRFENEDVNLYLPVESIYTDINFQYIKGKTLPGTYSPLHRIHNNYAPLHKYATLKLKTTGLPEELESKALIANYNVKSGSYSSWGGEYENGWITTKTRAFGDVCVTIDTIAPYVRSLSIKGNKLNERNRIRFKIFDELAGIKEYEGKIDGKWVLFEYDAKRDLIEYNFDEKIKKGKQHKIELKVIDNRDNITEFDASFYY